MRAMVLPDYKAVLEPAELPDPVPPPGGAVVQVAAAGVCHSDLHLIDGEIPMIPAFPWVLGHEVAGYVAAVGDGVRSVRPGDAVAVFGGWGCGACRFCLGGEEQLCDVSRWAGIGAQGAYAEYIAVPGERHLVPLQGLDPVQAAPLTDAGLTPYRALRKVLPLLGPASHLVTIGAGGLGQYGVQYAGALSPARTIVVETAADKRAQAHALGAHVVLDPTGPDVVREIHDLTEGRGAAAVIDFVGSDDTLALAAQVVGAAGRIVVVGIAGGALPVSFLGLPVEVEVMTSYWGSRNELADVVALAQYGKLHSPLTEYPLTEANAALDDLRRGKVAGRAVLIP